MNEQLNPIYEFVFFDESNILYQNWHFDCTQDCAELFLSSSISKLSFDGKFASLSSDKEKSLKKSPSDRLLWRIWYSHCFADEADDWSSSESGRAMPRLGPACCSSIMALREEAVGAVGVGGT